MTKSGSDAVSIAHSPNRSASTGMMVLLAAITMLFAALSSAYVVRKGLAGDWSPLPLPRLWPATALLLIAASVLLYWGRRSLQRSGKRAFLIAWFGGAAISLLCIALQLYIWRQIGRPPAANPSVAFFYVLSGAFLIFQAGCGMAVMWTGFRAYKTEPASVASGLTCIVQYCCYLTVVWLYLGILFFVWN